MISETAADWPRIVSISRASRSAWLKTGMTAVIAPDRNAYFSLLHRAGMVQHRRGTRRHLVVEPGEAFRLRCFVLLQIVRPPVPYGLEKKLRIDSEGTLRVPGRNRIPHRIAARL